LYVVLDLRINIHKWMKIQGFVGGKTVHSLACILCHTPQDRINAL